MNFKKVVPALLAGAMLVTPVAAFAAPNEAETEGRIRFIADPSGGGIYDIHHPDNSGDTSTDGPLWITPLPPAGEGLHPNGQGGPDGPGTAGGYGVIPDGTEAPLRINFAPNFYFGTQLISDVNQYYHPYFLRAGVSQRRATQADVDNPEIAEATAVDVWIPHRTPTVTGERVNENIPHFIQITDARGTMGGWSLTVANTPFSAARGEDFQGSAFNVLFPDETNNRHVLLGATITFATAYVAHNTYANNPLNNVGVHTTDLVLDGTGAQRNVMAAAAGSGAGIHQAVWGTQADANLPNNPTNAAITLAVPGTSTQLAGIDYTTTLTWRLSAVPGNDNVSSELLANPS